MANTMELNQVSTVLNGIIQQATGNAELANADTKELITVAQTQLLTAPDNLINAVSQVLSRTIFSNRPYTRKFKGLEADSIRYGNHVRKINYVDGTWTDNGYLPITDGESVDQQKPVKPSIIQTNFYGQNDYEVDYTIFRDQLATAFNSPEELGSFVTSQVQNISDRVEQKHEVMARAVIDNLVTGIATIANGRQVVHLLSEYNALTGLELTATTVYQPANFAPFMRWVYARIASISSLMTERSQIFHENITDKPIQRHTPVDYQRLYMYAPAQFQIQANALAETYRDYDIFKPNITEQVNYWQSINTPESVVNTPVYMQADGTLTSPDSPVTVSHLFAVLMDQEAAGYTVCNYRNTTAPYNGKGEYQNFFMKFTDRYWNDFTENAVIFLLD